MTTGSTGSTLPCARAVRVVAVFALAIATGCVERRFIIESNIPEAQVYIDHNPIGAAPAHAAFDYYGKYNITIVHPGYETFTKDVPVEAPWYSYPPIDFLAEVIWPFPIRDNRRYYFPLQELPRTRVDDLLTNAEALRKRGEQLPTPAQPAPPKVPAGSTTGPVPPNVAQPGLIAPREQSLPPGALPPGALQPAPVIPPGVLQPAPGVPPGNPSANSPIPSVLP